MKYACAICGTKHDGLPMCFGADAPWRELGVKQEEFDERVDLTEDQCVVDSEHFFVRGHIEIPVESQDQPFTWSVWCSLSKDSFVRASSLWGDEDRVGESYFGWLCTNLPCYEVPTLHLKTNVRFQELGVVFSVELQECDHPLWREQRYGIPIDRVWKIAHHLVHPDTI